MKAQILLAAAIFVMFGSFTAFAAEAADKDKDSKSSKLTDSPTYKEIQHQGNRIGDELGKNIGQAFRNANEGFKKRFNTNKPEK